MILTPSQLTRRDWERLTFGFVWRAAVCFILSTILISVLSFPAQYALGRMFDSEVPTRMQSAVSSFTSLALMAIALVVCGYVFLRWVLAARFGSMRLVLITGEHGERTGEALHAD